MFDFMDVNCNEEMDQVIGFKLMGLMGTVVKLLFYQRSPCLFHTDVGVRNLHEAVTSLFAFALSWLKSCGNYLDINLSFPAPLSCVFWQGRRVRCVSTFPKLRMNDVNHRSSVSCRAGIVNLLYAGAIFAK